MPEEVWVISRSRVSSTHLEGCGMLSESRSIRNSTSRTGPGPSSSTRVTKTSVRKSAPLRSWYFQILRLEPVTTAVCSQAIPISRR